MSIRKISGASREFSQCISRRVSNKHVLEVRGKQQGQWSGSVAVPSSSSRTVVPRLPRATTSTADRRCLVGCVAKLIDSFFNNYS